MPPELKFGGVLMNFNGTDGVDRITTGNSTNDTYNLRKGSDTVKDYWGNDIYIFNMGDGFDAITDSNGTDVVRFGAGISKNNITISRQYNHVIISIDGTSDGITLMNWYENAKYKVERIEFADGSFLTSQNVESIIAGGGLNTINGTDWDETINGTSGKDTIYAKNGDDYVYAKESNDTIYGGDGRDILSGDAGEDTMYGGRGDDDFYVDNVNDKATEYANEGTDKVRSTVSYTIGDNIENLTLIGNNDIIGTGNSLDNLLYGNDANNTFYGMDGNDIIWGNGGNDALYGGNGDDILEGRVGNDYEEGGAGNDIYNFSRGHGQDTIYDTSGTNRIEFGAGIVKSDIEFSVSNNDLVIKIKNSTDSLTLKDWLINSAAQLARVEFVDNTYLTAADINSQLINTINGTDGDDYLYGTEKDDNINGFGGNDSIYGGLGNDTIIAGKGNDTIYLTQTDWESKETGTDTIKFNRGDGQDSIILNEYGDGFCKIVFGPDIKEEDIEVNSYIFSPYGDEFSRDITIRIKNTDDSLSLQLHDMYGEYSIYPQFQLSDGTVLNIGEFIVPNQIIGTNSNDTLYTQEPDEEIIQGLDGDDYIGLDYNSWYSAPSDTIIGGRGNDTIYTANGNDTIVFNLGDGRDTLAAYSSGNDTIRFGAGIQSDRLEYYMTNNNLSIIISDQDSITIQDWANNSVNRLEFNDNSSLSYEDITNIINNQQVISLPIGVTATDLRFHETTEPWGSSEGDVKSDLTYAKNSITISFTNQPGEIILNDWQGISLWNQRDYIIQFSDGTHRRLADLLPTLITGTAYGDNIDGFSNVNLYDSKDGDDIIHDNGGDDTFIGGKGNDTIYDEYGIDTYIFNAGDGQDQIYDTQRLSINNNNTIKFGMGISQENLVFTKIDDDILINFKNSTDSLYLHQNFNYAISTADLTLYEESSFNNFEFTGGTVKTLKDFSINEIGTNGSDNLWGTNGSDYIEAKDGNDTVHCSYSEYRWDWEADNFGNDTVNAGKGNDTVYNYGFSNDTYVFNQGDGQDIIWDEYGTDKIKFGSGITKSNLKITYRDTYGLIEFNNSIDRIEFNRGTFEQIEFADGSTMNKTDIINFANGNNPITPTVIGTNGNDNFSNYNGNDIYYTKSGYDIIKDYYGNDTYLFNRGDQWDTITDNQGADTVRLGDNITLADLSFVRSGNNLNLSIRGTSDGMTVVNWFYAGKYQLENFQLANGSTLTNTQINSMV